MAQAPCVSSLFCDSVLSSITHDDLLHFPPCALGGLWVPLDRLVVKIPSLQRLGLKGCLHGDKGGPDAVCDHVPRLTALRELDVSHCP